MRRNSLPWAHRIETLPVETSERRQVKGRSGELGDWGGIGYRLLENGRLETRRREGATLVHSGLIDGQRMFFAVASPFLFFPVDVTNRFWYALPTVSSGSNELFHRHKLTVADLKHRASRSRRSRLAP